MTFWIDTRPFLVQDRAQEKLLHQHFNRQSLPRPLGNASKAFQALEIQWHTRAGLNLGRHANRFTRKPYSDCTAEPSTLLHFQNEGGYHPQLSSPDQSLGHRWRTCGSDYRLLLLKPDLRASSIKVARHLSSPSGRQCPRKRGHL